MFSLLNLSMLIFLSLHTKVITGMLKQEKLREIVPFTLHIGIKKLFDNYQIASCGQSEIK